MTDAPLRSSIDAASYSGLKLGRYRLEALLASGGMGHVYAARNELGGRCAIKVLDLVRAAEPALLRRFAQEAQITAKLDHENIVQVQGYGSEDVPGLGAVHYMVMEELRGRSLKKLLREQPSGLEAERAVDLIRDAARGLHEAHRQGIVHRDIKPDNLFACEGSRGEFCRVLDFGIAKVPDQSLTGEDVTFGTLAYMAPEQLQNGQVDARTDVRALGLVLYELLSGKSPFECDDSRATRSTILAGETPDAPTNDPPLSDVVLKALRQRAAERYQSVQEFYDALEPFAAHKNAPITAGARARNTATAPTLFPPSFPASGREPTSLHSHSLTQRPRTTASWTPRTPIVLLVLAFSAAVGWPVLRSCTANRAASSASAPTSPSATQPSSAALPSARLSMSAPANGVPSPLPSTLPVVDDKQVASALPAAPAPPRPGPASAPRRAVVPAAATSRPQHATVTRHDSALGAIPDPI